ncbi:hypothetical protein DCMF_27085 [Candidatus Formimonas warabiya]|uniref:ATP-binding protein n=1 Tax=Formimonas warabiya TaxID=1761012 RepID=A0A3G1KZV3_FORW1|nr:hypothetical protein DCMF_27085 [Candidatus Formimonas warabiya]
MKLFPKRLISNNFDLFGLNTEIEEFGRKQLLSPRQVTAIQLVLEELCIGHILKKMPQRGFELDFNVAYSEVDDQCEITISFDGERFDPFEAAAEDDMSLLIVKRFSKSINVQFDEKNRIDIIV